MASARFSKEHSCPWDTEIPYEDERSLYHSRGVTWWGGDDGVMPSLAAHGHVCAMRWVCKQEGRILDGIKSGAACVAAAGGGHLEALEFAYSKAGVLGYNYADEWVIEIYTKTAAIEAVSAGHVHILEWMLAFAEGARLLKYVGDPGREESLACLAVRIGMCSSGCMHTTACDANASKTMARASVKFLRKGAFAFRGGRPKAGTSTC